MNKKKVVLKKSKAGHYYVKNIPSREKLIKYYENKYFKINPRYFKNQKILKRNTLITLQKFVLNF